MSWGQPQGYGGSAPPPYGQQQQPGYPGGDPYGYGGQQQSVPGGGPQPTVGQGVPYGGQPGSNTYGAQPGYGGQQQPGGSPYGSQPGASPYGAQGHGQVPPTAQQYGGGGGVNNPYGQSAAPPGQYGGPGAAPGQPQASNPYGQSAVPPGQYGGPGASPYGAQSAPPGQYGGSQGAAPNQYGQQQQPGAPYAGQGASPNQYGQQQAPPNQYGQQQPGAPFGGGAASAPAGPGPQFQQAWYAMYYHQIPQEHIGTLHQWFALVDKDRSGKISAVELGTMQFPGTSSPANAVAGKPIGLEVAAKVIALFDASGKQEIDVFEYCAFFQFCTKLQQSFAAVDTKNKGDIDAAQTKAALAQSGFEVSLPTVDTFWKVRTPPGATRKGLDIPAFLNLALDLASIRQEFLRRDADGDGKLNMDEVMAVVATCGAKTQNASSCVIC